MNWTFDLVMPFAPQDQLNPGSLTSLNHVFIGTFTPILDPLLRTKYKSEICLIPTSHTAITRANPGINYYKRRVFVTRPQLLLYTSPLLLPHRLWATIWNLPRESPYEERKFNHEPKYTITHIQTPKQWSRLWLAVV